MLTFLAKKPFINVGVCSKNTSLLSLKKKATYLIWYDIILYNFINCPVFVDTTQILHYKVPIEQI